MTCPPIPHPRSAIVSVLSLFAIYFATISGVASCKPSLFETIGFVNLMVRLSLVIIWYDIHRFIFMLFPRIKFVLKRTLFILLKQSITNGNVPEYCNFIERSWHGGAGQPCQIKNT